MGIFEKKINLFFTWEYISIIFLGLIITCLTVFLSLIFSENILNYLIIFLIFMTITSLTYSFLNNYIQKRTTLYNMTIIGIAMSIVYYFSAQYMNNFFNKLNETLITGLNFAEILQIFRPITNIPLIIILILISYSILPILDLIKNKKVTLTSKTIQIPSQIVK